MSKSKLLLIEDQTLVRKSLAALINLSDRHEIVYSTETIKEAMTYLKKDATIDLILCDYALRGETALDFLEQYKSLGSTPVILLTSFFNARHLRSCINLGARGFLFKECDVDELEDAFDAVLNGETCFKLMEPSEQSRLNLSQSPENELTPKEEEALRWLATGMSNKEIAKALNKSDQTVKAQIRELMRKLKVASRTEAVIKATKFNII